MENFVPLPYGGATRRPALEYKFDSVDNDKVRLVPFTFSVSDTYLLAIGDQEINIYKDSTLKGTVAAPWSDTELDDVKWAQSADVMWFVHPDYPIQRLERAGDTVWSMSAIEFDFPPLLDENSENIFFDLTFNETAWVASSNYDFGDVVQYEGVVYKCIIAHAGSTRFDYDWRRGYWFPSNEGSQATLKAYDSTGERLTSTQYAWTVSGSEYYVTLRGGGNPNLTEPDVVREDFTTDLTPGTIGSLAAGEWAWGDNDALGFNTIYVRLSDSTDPDGKNPDGYLTALNYSSYFNADMVGGQIAITNQRNQEEIRTKADGTFFVAQTNFSEVKLSLNSVNDYTYPIYVGGSNWSVDVTGGTTFTIRCVIEFSDDYGANWNDYVFVGDTTGGATKILSASSDSEEPLGRLLRLKCLGGTGTREVTFNVDNSSFTGFVNIDSYISTNEVTVTVDSDIQKDLSVGVKDSTGLDNGTGTTGTERTKFWQEGAFSDYNGYPCCVALFENRLSFAGTTRNPDRLWMSQIDDYQNFLATDTDTGSLDLTLNSGSIDEIRWMVPQERLIIGTAGSEWSLGASDERKAITPTGFDLKRKTTYGSNKVQGILVNSAVLFLMRQSRKVREWTPAYNLQDHVAPDLSILSEHITDGGVSQWDYQQQPDNVLWSIRADGTLLGFTYERDQNVTGWHRHANDEFSFESVAVLPRDNGEDEVWASVNMGGTRMIGRFADREWGTDLSSEWSGSDLYVDYQAPGDADHLIGKTVELVVDGVPQGTQVVDGSGNVTGATGTVNIVGLPFTSTLAPVWHTLDSQYGSSRGDKIGNRNAVIRFKDTYSAKVGQTLNSLEVAKFDPDATALYNDDVQTWYDNASEWLISTYIVQDDPMPCTVLAAIFDVEV